MADSLKPDQPSPPTASWEARARTWVALVFGLAAVSGAAYYFFVQQAHQRRSALEARYAQRVAHVARQAERKLQVYRKIVKSTLDAAEDAAHGRAKDKLLPSYVPLLEACRKSSGSDEDVPDALATSLCLAGKLARIAAPSPSAPGNALAFRVCPDLDKADKARSTTREGDRVLFFHHGGQLCGELPIAALFPDRATHAERTSGEEPLVGLVLLDRAGSSIWQEPSAALRLRALPGPKESSSKSSPGSNDGAPTPALSSEVALGSGTYRAFVEPLDVSLSSADGQVSVCGLISKDSLARQSKRIDAVSLLWAGLLLVLGALSFPVAKLWLLAPRSRFRIMDVRLLVLCAIAATLVTASVFLGFLARYRLSEHLDDRLQASSLIVQKRLQGKLDDAEKALQALEARLKFDDPAPERLCLRPGCRVMAAGSPRAVCECTHQHGQDQLYGPDATRRGFQRAFWSAREGDQLLKLAPGPHATPPLNLARRGYFQRALKLGEQRCRLGTPEAAPTVFEIVRSMTSGAIVLVAARPTCGQLEGASGTANPAPALASSVNGVLGVEASLDDFAAPLLPPGFQLAVVDAQGKLVLHSDNDAHLDQSIFDEIEELDTLASLGRGPATGITYLGEPSRVSVRSMDAGFWLLTIAPQASADGPALSMTLATLELCAMMLVGGLLLWLLLRFIRLSLHASASSHPRLSRLLALTTFRPYPKLGGTYAWLGMSLFAAAGVTAAITLCEQPGPIACGVLTLVIAAVLYSFAHGRPAPPRVGLARAYATYCFGASAALLVMPAVRAFAGCYEHHVETLVREEVAHVWGALDERHACFLGECGDVFTLLPEQAEEPAAGTPPQQQAEIVDTSWLGALAMGAERALFAPIAEVLAQFPALAQPHPELPQLEWEQKEDYTLVSYEGRHARVLVPRLIQPEYPLLGSLFMLCALLALALGTFTLWTRSIGRLFFIDALVWPCKQPKDVAALKALFAVNDENGGGSGHHVPAKPAPRQGVLYLHAPKDLAKGARDADGFADWTKRHGEHHDQTTILVIPELRDVFDNPALLSALERAFERAQQGSLRVVVFSQLDPLDAPPSALRERWLALFASFSCIRGTDYETVRPDSPAALALAWETSSDDERRFLSQLAFDGHASPSRQNLPLVRRLVARGLLDRETFVLAHDELREYVRSRSSTASLREEEAKDGGSPWSMLRVPIATLVLAILAGVSQSQPEGLTLTLPGLALSLPIMLRSLISVAATRVGGEKIA